MRLRYSLIAIVLFASSTFCARADNFALTFYNIEPQFSDTVTFYLPPGTDLAGPPFALVSLDGYQFMAQLGFWDSEEMPPGGALNIDGGPFVDSKGCNNCEGWFASDDAFVNPTSETPFILGTHTGSFSQGGPFEPATLVITPDASTVPEPSSIMLFGTGALMLGFAARRRFGHGQDQTSLHF
jgi:hypothetical protein